MQIERFFLYGEPPRPADERFVHLEFLDERSRPANWIIRPHSHADLHHVFYLSAGGGTAEADGRRLSFAAPSVVVVPETVVHGFAWAEESAGLVLTFSDTYLRTLAARDSSVHRAFSNGMWTAPAAGARWEGMLSALRREVDWRAPAHDLAVEFALGTVLIELLRLHHDISSVAHAPISARALLVARYRERVEELFRCQPTIASLARDVGVSAATLRVACQDVAGASPAEILRMRVSLEARRLMRYSNMSVGQIAAYLGFSDPAYFSRFFARETGRSPRTYKEASRATQL